MAKIRELPLANYPSGTRTFVKQTPNGLAGFLIGIARCTTPDQTIWPNASSKIRITVENSYDGGLTFPANGGGCAFSSTGGIETDKEGTELNLSTFSCRFSPIEPNAVRITVTIINGPIRTYADVTIL